jgi:DNA replication protein DnaC
MLTQPTSATLKSFLERLTDSIPEAGCEKCLKGYIRHKKEKGIGFTYEFCECKKERERLVFCRNLLRNSNIPSRVDFVYVATNRSEEYITSALLWEILDKKDRGNNWIFFCGKAGTGKTFSAIFTVLLAVYKEMSAYFVNVTELLENMRPNRIQEDSAVVLLQKCQEVDVLVLDDIGHEKASDWVKERLYLIINSRWDKGKITVFTSNFAVERLKDMVSEAVYSRVKGDALEVFMKGEDKRINN